MTGHVRTAALPAAVATVLAFGALDPALAKRAQSERERDVQSKQSQTQREQTRQATGQVIGMKTVDMRGTNMVNQIVHLKTDKGQRVIADLGLKEDSQLRTAKIQVGDRIGVRGQAVRIGDKMVLAADQLRVEGKTYRLDRDRQASRHSRAQQAQTRQAIGEIIGMKNVQMRGTDIANQVVHLKTDKGQRVVADLGLRQDPQLRTARIQVGDRIGVRGQAVRIGDRMVLAANQLRVEGKTYRLDRDRQISRLQKEMDTQQQRQARKEMRSAEKEKMAYSRSTRSSQSGDRSSSERDRYAASRANDDIARSSEGSSPEQDRYAASRTSDDASRYAGSMQPQEFRTQAERDLVERVRTRLKNDAELASSAENIRISADLGGEITLRGQVSSEQDQEKIIAAVRDIRGVNEVRNRLQVISSGNMAKITN